MPSNTGSQPCCSLPCLRAALGGDRTGSRVLRTRLRRPLCGRATASGGYVRQGGFRPLIKLRGVALAHFPTCRDASNRGPVRARLTRLPARCAGGTSACPGALPPTARLAQSLSLRNVRIVCGSPQQAAACTGLRPKPATSHPLPLVGDGWLVVGLAPIVFLFFSRIEGCNPHLFPVYTE